MKESQRVKQYREKKAASNDTQHDPSSTPYHSFQTRGKAIKRVKQSMPFSPRKRRCVVESIALEVGPNIASSPVSMDYCGLSEDTKQLVLAFYNSNEVSWQAPGRKDSGRSRPARETSLPQLRAVGLYGPQTFWTLQLSLGSRGLVQ